MGACSSLSGPGRIRVIRHGVLDPKPIGGVPEARTKGNGGLMDIALHPKFAENHLVYFTYDKPVENDKGAPTVARGKLEGGALSDVRDIVVTDAYEGTGGLSARIAFGRDGMLFMATGGNVGWVAQEPGSLGARFCACATMARRRPIIPSWAVPVTGPRSTRWGTAIH